MSWALGRTKILFGQNKILVSTFNFSTIPVGLLFLGQNPHILQALRPLYHLIFSFVYYSLLVVSYFEYTVNNVQNMLAKILFSSVF